MSPSPLTPSPYLKSYSCLHPSLVLTCKCPPPLFLLLQPLTPTHIQARWQDNAHGFIGHLQKSTTSQIQASQYRESDPNPASPSIDPHKDCSHSKRCQSIKDFESFQTILFYFFCCFSSLRSWSLFPLSHQFVVSCQFCPIFCGHLTSSFFPHCEPLGPIQCATNTNKQTQNTQKTQLLVSKWVQCEPLVSTLAPASERVNSKELRHWSQDIRCTGPQTQTHKETNAYILCTNTNTLKNTNKNWRVGWV